MSKFLASLIFALMFCKANTINQEVETYLNGRIAHNNHRRATFEEALKLAKERNVKIIVETGTARDGYLNFAGDGGFTIIFGHWAFDNKAKLFSVDINKTNLDNAKLATQEYQNISVFHVLSDSVEFLKNFDQKIDFLYLDSLDYDFNNPAPSQEHHLKEIIAAYDKLTDNSIIMLDDCLLPVGGKCRLVIDYLLERCWKIHTAKYQTIFLKH